MARNRSSVDEKTLYSRRTFLLGAAQMGLMGAVVGRLIYLGGYKASHYQTLSKENHVKLRILLPERGAIVDVHGRPLVLNRSIYRLVLQPEGRQNLEDLHEKLHAMMDLSSLTLDTLLAMHEKIPRHRPLILKEPISWPEVCRLEMMTIHMPGLTIEKGQRRYYPHGAMCAPLLGYVQIPSEKDGLAPSLMTVPDLRVGRLGLEKVYDESLRGQAGFEEIEVTAHRRVQRILRKQEGHQGVSLTCTVDLTLQEKIYERIQTMKSAVVLAMDVHTGAMPIFLSFPSYDNNLFIQGIPKGTWKELQENPFKPLVNLATQGLYAPGSLFKMVVALAGLKSGLWPKNTVVHCPGFMDLYGHRFHCHSRIGHGSVTLKRAIAESCDVYFYELAKKVGIDHIQAMAHAFGLGHETGIVLPNEKTGIVPGKDWVSRTQKRSWRVSDTVLTSIGQGFCLTTPMQMLVLMAGLANGQKLITPRLTDQDPQLSKSLDISPEHLKWVQEGLFEVVNGPRGTSRRHALPGSLGFMAGKTGTSQVRRISLAERKKGVLKNSAIQWLQRDHGFFGGYAPAHQPKYACLVLVPHGGSGSHVAAPIARDVLKYLLEKERL